MIISKEEKRLIPLLTATSLPTLVEAEKCNGWMNDYTEIKHFVLNMFDMANKEVPDLEPYEVTEQEGNNKETEKKRKE